MSCDNHAHIKGGFMKNRVILLLVLVVLAGFFITGCTQQQPAVQTPQATSTPSSDTIGTSSTSLGTILVDSNGKTLYYFANDIPSSGASACAGQCAAIWPAFTVETITVSPPLSAADFGTITRADGTMQTTYKGSPLYYYASDTMPGDMKGQGINNIWFVADVAGFKPAATSTTNTPMAGY